jgi:hypothetical protein
MGKTGSIEWVQIRGRKGQMRLVPRGDSQANKPGPSQRYDARGFVSRVSARTKKNVLGVKSKAKK